jgi:RNA polymerase sigma factor (sigma-70 family)
MISDRTLLRQYVNERSENAFSQLVERHMKLVYWTCRRDIRDPQLSEDATQEVFLALARKAPSLHAGVSISGWLFTTSRLIARNATRKEIRRIRYEEEAAREMDTAPSPAEPGWEQLESRLNDALAALKAQDREAVLMRFFDGLTMQEIASTTGTTENAATKRVVRAVDRLRLILQKQESTLTSATLTALLNTHLTEPAPTGCHAAIMRDVPAVMAGHAVAGSGIAAQTTLLQKGIVIAMQLTTGKIVAAGAATVLIGFLGIGGWVVIHRARSLDAAAAQVTVLDPAIQDPAPSGSPDADRTTIDAEYQSVLEGIGRADVSGFTASLAPEWTIFYPGGRQLTRAQAVYAAQRLVAMTKSFKYNGTVSSYQRQGDTADVTLNSQEDLTLSDDMKTTHDMAVTGIQEDRWVKRNGTWVRTSSHVLSVQATIDGKPAPGP